jgi:hypothetical protein
MHTEPVGINEWLLWLAINKESASTQITMTAGGTMVCRKLEVSLSKIV